MIAVCRRLGGQAVQLWGERVEQCFDHPGRAGALEQAGIAVAGIAGYRNLVDPDGRERRENIEYLARCLELAPRIGTSVVATESGTRNTAGPWQWSAAEHLRESVQQLHDAVGRLVEVAERSSSILALRCRSARAGNSAHGARRRARGEPSRHLQAVLDPVRLLARAMHPAAEQVARGVSTASKVLAHLKDICEQGAEAVGTRVGDQHA